MNQGSGAFAEAAAAHGLDSLRDGRGLAISDFDGDGDLDLIINNYNAAPHYFLNGAARGHWLKVRLRGRESNRDGVGAVVRLEAGGRRQMRVVTAGESYASEHSFTCHFGLGEVEQVETLEVLWPRGRVQKLSRIPVDRQLLLDELDADHPVAAQGGGVR